MVIFPGRNARSPHKKLLWNNFGPYKITELLKSTALCVPVDRNTEAIEVPIERLVRVPPGIPDIATLPKGKSPYRNMIKTNRDKNQGTIFLLGAEKTMAKLTVDQEEPMELDPDFEWTEHCTLDGEHVGCKELIAAKLDAILDMNSTLGKLRVKSPIQAVFTIFLLKTGVAKSMSAAKSMLELMLTSHQGMELITLSGCRGDHIPTGNTPLEEDIVEALEVWMSHCNVAFGKMKQTGFGPIKITMPEGLNALPEVEASELKKAFQVTQWALEKVRAKLVANAKEFVTNPRVLIGDSIAKQLLPAFPKSQLIGQEGAVAGKNDNENRRKMRLEKHKELTRVNIIFAEVIRAVNNLVFSSKTKMILICAGKDAIFNGEAPKIVAEQLLRLLQLCQRFPHLRIFVIPPPFIQRKPKEYADLLQQLREMDDMKAHFVHLTKEGRSFIEMFRFGNSFNDHTTTIAGNLTSEGVNYVRAWLFTQVPGFLDDKALGIVPPSVPSRVIVPSQTPRSSGPSDRRTNSGPSDRRTEHRPYPSHRPFRGRTIRSPPRRNIHERISHYRR